MSISRRQNILLDFVIREYIKRAEPIPSALVCRKSSRLHVSPATIRKEMTHLEDQGFLEQRHTSGGRVPTDKGYRYFVNNLLVAENSLVAPQEQKQIRSALASGGNDPRSLSKNIAEVLSDCSDNLVITGIDPDASVGATDFFKMGLTSLFEMPEFQEFDRMFQLTSFFEQFENIFRSFESELMEKIDDDYAVINIFIGHENPLSQVRDETIMVAKYLLPGDYVGSLALIGPTRMNYEKNIALIKFTTKELERIT